MPTALIRRVELIWAGLAGAPFYTQLFFGHEPGQANPTATAVKTLLDNLNTALATGLTCEIVPEQTVIDTVSGKPVSLEAATPKTINTFSATGDPLPWTSQGIVRLPTSIYNDGRRLRGHFNIPGMMESQSANGVLAAPTKTQFDGFLATFLASTNTTGKLAVWSRRHQMWASAESAVMWTQFGVLRSRRPG
jgi:hypothetical protein